MVRVRAGTPSRRPINATLPDQLLEEAKSLDLNIGQAGKQELKSAIASIRAQQWLADNGASLETSRQYVEETGFPWRTIRTSKWPVLMCIVWPDGEKHVSFWMCRQIFWALWVSVSLFRCCHMEPHQSLQ